jgi:hypothetical protein
METTAMRKSIRLPVGVAAAVTLLACEQRSEPTPEQAADVANLVRAASDAPSAASSGAQPGSPPANTSNVDPCTFFTKAELESAVGYPLGPAKPIRGEPTCRFPNPTRGTVTVRAGELVTPAQFDSLKLYTGPDIEPVSGVGDRAFLWGARIYVLSGNRQLMVNLDKHELTPDVRATLTSLAKLGVPRLR